MSCSQFFFILLAIGYGMADLNISPYLVKDFFADKLVNQVVIFACWQTRESVEFQRVLIDHGMRTEMSLVAADHRSDVRRVLAVNYYKLGVVLDLDCEGGELILREITEQNIPYNESYIWLLATTSNALPRALLETLPLTVESELVVAVVRSSDDHCDLFDVYNPSYRHDGALNVTIMGSWAPDQGLRNHLTQYKYERRRDFRGIYLNVSIVITHPPVPDFRTYITQPIERHLDSMHRFNYALVSHLRDYYNFEMNLMRADSWGYLINGTFDGMLGDMIDGTVDIGATPLQFKEERIDAAEFTVQTWLARPCFIFRHPNKNSVRDGFSRPFLPEVWWTVVFVAAAYMVSLLATVEVDLFFNPRPPDATLDSHPVSESGLIVLAALCQQGLTDGPRFYAGRVVFLSLFVWGFLLYQFYSASIVGSLLSKPPRNIITLEDLLNSNLRIGIEDISYNYDFFAVHVVFDLHYTTTDPVALKLYKRKVAAGRNRKRAAYYNPVEGMRLVQKGGFAFHADVATAYKIITDTFSEDEICDLAEIQLFPPKHTATVTSKHSPFKKMVTYGMRKIIERGMGKRLRAVWHYARPTCPKDHSSIPVPVPFDEFSPAIYLLAVSFVAAAFLLVIERMIRRRAAMKK